MGNNSSIGSIGDLLGESRRDGCLAEHLQSHDGLFSSFIFTNNDQTLSTLRQDQLSRLHSLYNVLFRPSKCNIYHYCHFSVRVNIPERALAYVRRYVHKLVGKFKFIQVILHETDNVHPHFHFIYCGKTSPPRTNAMHHFLQYHCNPYRPIVHGSHKFTTPIAAAFRCQLLYLYLVGRTGYYPVVFQIASQGSNPIIHTGYHLFPSADIHEKSGEFQTDPEEADGCTTSYTKERIYPIRARSRGMEPGLDGSTVNTNDHAIETQPGQDSAETRRSLLRRALQQKETTVLIAPTALELASLSVELYVTSIEILENFKHWQKKIIKLALKDQRLRENIFHSTEVIVDLETKYWKFEQIGRHVFQHNFLFPNHPCWFGSSGTPMKDYYNLCTSTMLYITIP